MPVARYVCLLLLLRFTEREPDTLFDDADVCHIVTTQRYASLDIIMMPCSLLRYADVRRDTAALLCRERYYALPVFINERWSEGVI